MTADSHFPHVAAYAPPHLPPLPPLVRYYDDFDEEHRSIRDLATSDRWCVVVNGLAQTLNLAIGLPWHTHLLKLFVADLLVSRATTTTVTYVSALLSLPSALLIKILETLALEPPRQFRESWILEFHSSLRPDQMRAVRYLAAAAARMAVGQWTAGDATIVRSLPGAPLDKYARVRSGECFLPLRAQSEIVEFIDDAANRARGGAAAPDLLRLACVLALAYQYGLRAGQIARITAGDVRCFPSGSVHVSVALLKQRGQQRGRTVIRSVQREWCDLFREFARLRPDGLGTKFFGYIPTEISALVSELTAEITGVPYTPSDLRHTAAQRLVDGGASREQVSEFLGHTNNNTADAYFEASAKQAELVNAALGLSDIYRNVVEVARTGTISPELLRRGSPDQQVGGMPHGVAVTGVGLCRSGQSMCQRNPILACYTCHKFLPVSDVTIHAELLARFREVVKAFERPNHVDRVPAAMLQLRATLEAIQRLVAGLQAGGAKSAR